MLTLLCLLLSSPDWLIEPGSYKARVESPPGGSEITLTNGLVRRVFRLQPNGATVALDNLVTGQSLLRSVRPEATLDLDGRRFAIGGLSGQPDHAYLRRDWIDRLTADPQSFRFTRFEAGKTAARFPWRLARYAANTTWPPPGVSLILHFAPPAGLFPGVAVEVHYELYEGLPVMAKWLVVRNQSDRTVRLDAFNAEILAAVEYESQVETAGPAQNPYLQIESDYSFVATHPGSGASLLAHWVPDKLYTTQVNYRLDAPLLLEVRPPLGPAIDIAPGGRFESFRVFELLHDSTERERRGLAVRRMYRALAPWATENPILMHVRRADPDSVRLAIDQCAATGFEMVIMTFGSGFNLENEDPAYLAQVRELVEYGRARNVELGGYSLLASRKISPADDVIDAKTGLPGHAIFENSPCLGSRWANDYFRRAMNFIEQTGLAVLEHDGSYPGDVCASTTHPGHRALEDSQWTQWLRIAGFYQWCRARGVYLNVPDWYFLAGSNKSAMGYREVNWSLPRDRQLMLARQNLYDGTWEKAPSMGWMFIPLVEYHGGGAAATLEPLNDHLDAYEQHLVQNFTAGVQACYRGPRLYDSDATRAVVQRWVSFYKQHRDILDSDVIHLRRADGRDWDGLLHVNPRTKEKALAFLFNPLDEAITRKIRLPLYYTGLTAAAQVSIDGSPVRAYSIARDYSIEVEVRIPARRWSWIAVM